MSFGIGGRSCRGAHKSFAKKVAAQLAKGDFIPNKPGAIGHGYDLWARHPNGDVILHCGGNAGWFDWFTPAWQERPDFVLTIDGEDYQLVRGVDVDHMPAGFEVISASQGLKVRHEDRMEGEGGVPC